MLALSDRDQCVGPDIAGSLEEALLRQAVKDHSGDKPVQIHHAMTDSDCRRFRLPGGEITLLVEPLHGGPALKDIETLQARLNQRQRVTRSIGHDGMSILDSSPLSSGISVEHHHVLHTLLPEFRLLLIGAGDVSLAIALQANRAGFEVSLCEPRDTFRSHWDEGIAPLLSGNPEAVIPDRFSDRHCAILALSRDAAIDDSALVAAMDGDAFFIGALGDGRVSAMRRQRLHDLGVADHVMARLHAPLGFEIGSRTPAEVAVAAMAQMISERYRQFYRPNARR